MVLQVFEVGQLDGALGAERFAKLTWRTKKLTGQQNLAHLGSIRIGSWDWASSSPNLSVSLIEHLPLNPISGSNETASYRNGHKDL